MDKYSVVVHCTLGELWNECPSGLGESERAFWERRDLEGIKGVSLNKIKGWKKMFQIEFTACAGHREQKRKEVGRRKEETEGEARQ